MKDERKEAEKRLIESHARWEHLYTQGGSDPFWADGGNLNLVRNHIIYERRILEGLGYFPEIYGREIPPEVDPDYMARADEIKRNAKEVLESYQSSENYQYLLKNADKIRRKIDNPVIGNVMGYVRGLEVAIDSGDIIVMRRHEKGKDSYLSSLKRARDIAEITLEEPQEEKIGQLDIWDL
jgi:hypothetical protein